MAGECPIGLEKGHKFLGCKNQHAAPTAHKSSNIPTPPGQRKLDHSFPKGWSPHLYWMLGPWSIRRALRVVSTGKTSYQSKYEGYLNSEPGSRSVPKSGVKYKSGKFNGV